MDGSKDIPILGGSQEPDADLTKAGAGTTKPKIRQESISADRPPVHRFTTSHANTLQEYFIGAIDQGTTSTRFIIFNGIGEPVAMHQIEFKQIYPESG